MLLLHRGFGSGAFFKRLRNVIFRVSGSLLITVLFFLRSKDLSVTESNLEKRNLIKETNYITLFSFSLSYIAMSCLALPYLDNVALYCLPYLKLPHITSNYLTLGLPYRVLPLFQDIFYCHCFCVEIVIDTILILPNNWWWFQDAKFLASEQHTNFRPMCLGLD